VPHQAAFARSTRRRSSQADDGTVLAEFTGDAEPAAAAAALDAADLISKVTDAVNEELAAWRNWPLDRICPV
jgi:hypothetical protein